MVLPSNHAYTKVHITRDKPSAFVSGKTGKRRSPAFSSQTLFISAFYINFTCDNAFPILKCVPESLFLEKSIGHSEQAIMVLFAGVLFTETRLTIEMDRAFHERRLIVRWPVSSTPPVQLSAGRTTYVLSLRNQTWRIHRIAPRAIILSSVYTVSYIEQLFNGTDRLVQDVMKWITQLSSYYGWFDVVETVSIT